MGFCLCTATLEGYSGLTVLRTRANGVPSVHPDPRSVLNDPLYLHRRGSIRISTQVMLIPVLQKNVVNIDSFVIWYFPEKNMETKMYMSKATAEIRHFRNCLFRIKQNPLKFGALWHSITLKYKLNTSNFLRSLFLRIMLKMRSLTF